MRVDPLVSVVIDNYNYARYLSDAISSALAQTYARVEVIVVDDGSNDESREVIRSFGKDVNAIFKPNGGQASAFNVGIGHARGEIICLLDSDDKWDDVKVAEVVASAMSRASDGWALLRHNLRVRREPSRDAHAVDRTVPGIKRSFKAELIRGEDVLVMRRNAPTSALAFPRVAWDACGPVRPEDAFRISADAYLYTHLPRFGKVLSLGAVLGTYRVHGANNYYSRRPSEHQLQKMTDLEFSLMRSLPESVHLHDTLFALAHSDFGRRRGYLQELGSLPTRLRRVIGTDATEALRPSVLRIAVRELLRSVLR